MRVIVQARRHPANPFRVGGSASRHGVFGTSILVCSVFSATLCRGLLRIWCFVWFRQGRHEARDL